MLTLPWRLCLFQGDKEVQLGLPFSPLCDRKATMIAQSQIGKKEEQASPGVSERFKENTTQFMKERGREDEGSVIDPFLKRTGS